MRSVVLTVLYACALPVIATVGSFDDALRKLEPEERSHHACIIKGLETVHRDARMRDADRMKTSIFSRAVLNGTVLTAKGGAVRANKRWYALSFSCNLTTDFMRATS